MKTTLLSLGLGLLNRVLTGLILVSVMLFGPKAVIETKAWVQNAMLNLGDNTPYPTTARIYHQKDAVGFMIHRTANFTGSFTGVRLLRRIQAGTRIEEIISREEIKTVPIREGSHQYLAKIVLPDTLEPGRYYFQFITHFIMFGIDHERYAETQEFLIVPPDVTISDDLRFPTSAVVDIPNHQQP